MAVPAPPAPADELLAQVASRPAAAGELRALVASLRRGLLSRNRNYEQLSGGVGLEARRLWRFLRSVEKDVRAADEALACGDASIRQELLGQGHRLITIELPRIGLRRTTRLSAEEYALLVEDEIARRALEP